MSFWIAGSIVASGVIGAGASYYGAKGQEEAADKSNALNRDIYNKQVEWNTPYHEAGVNALKKQLQMLGLGDSKEANNFIDDPSYQFRFKEGQKALERSQSARGNVLSGGAGKELTRYGQDMASTEYSNAFNRLQQIMGAGQQATNTLTNSAQNYGTNQSNNYMNSANARASSYENYANAFNQSASAGVNAYQNDQYLKAYKASHPGVPPAARV